jgi:polyribonucleotide nucleotidyltransferase
VLSIETGELAKQASGAVVVRYGDSVVLTAAVAAPETRGVPFFPLGVEYREKQYAAGQFPGGIIKREGRPTTKEVLTCRRIDRPLRPLFPSGYHEEVQVTSWVLSSDGENDPDLLAMIGAAAALAISDIPFGGPVGACRVGLVEDEFIVNPTHQQRSVSEMDLVVSSYGHGIVMMEGSAASLPEDDLLTAIQVAHDVNVDVVALIEELVARCGKPKRAWEPFIHPEAAVEALAARYEGRIAAALRKAGKLEQQDALQALQEEALAELCDPEKPDAPTAADVSAALEILEDRALRRLILQEGARAGGRAMDEVRRISCQVGVLPRVHGSAVFTRGETQALVVTTLGSVQDRQRILDPLVEEAPKKFMLDYNFPPFSVGEVKPIRGPSRRDIGHGQLAELALQAVMPTDDEFPYTVRVVSDILESNGSSSMASICGAALSMMDAGVPLKNPVAGVAIGLIREGDRAVVLTDIAGAEDQLGDMDMKVAGTQHGVTAIQMDIKLAGVEQETLKRGLLQAREARMQILQAMLSVLPRPRESVSPYAPVLVKVKISPDNIGKLIGPGGKNIKGLEEKYQCNIEVEDDGTVTVSSEQGGRAQEAADYIGQLGRQVTVGAIYEGTVTELKDFGAIVELFPGADGLCHISQLDEGYVKDVASVCKVGDKIKVKVVSVEDNRVRLSRKAALKEEAAQS